MGQELEIGTPENFDQLTSAADGLVVAYFWGPECPNCEIFARDFPGLIPEVPSTVRFVQDSLRMVRDMLRIRWRGLRKVYDQADPALLADLERGGEAPVELDEVDAPRRKRLRVNVLVEERARAARADDGG
jgi:thiol-disulfide isomerase/thioredoxin